MNERYKIGGNEQANIVRKCMSIKWNKQNWICIKCKRMKSK